MISLQHYLDPVSIDGPVFEHLQGPAGFPSGISINTENNPVRDTSKFRIALLGVPDGRNSPSAGSGKAPDSIRSQLYSLSRIPGRLKILDLGNMKQGTSFGDTLAGLSDVLVYLMGKNIFPVVLGGSSSLIPAFDNTFSRTGTRYSLIAVDSRIDYLNEKKSTDSFNYLYGILHNNKSTLAHYTNIGYQTYLNDQQVVNRFLKRKSELIRTGDARKAIHLTEPHFRDADVAVFDISAVRQSDAPGTFAPSPNGFYGEEICLLSRYAGISDSLKMFGLFDVDPDLDLRSQTSALAAQMIWFFLEGFSQKQFETPALSTGNTGRFIRYHVRVTDLDNDLVFIKSNLTDRWWMELVLPDDTRKYLSCSHEDYLTANRNEVPERWIRASGRIKQ
jgi:arginase family enzyme